MLSQVIKKSSWWEKKLQKSDIGTTLWIISMPKWGNPFCILLNSKILPDEDLISYSLEKKGFWN